MASIPAIKIGSKYGRLTALSATSNFSKSRNQKYAFQCDCGKLVEAVGSAVKCGKTTSCGCYKRELSAQNVIKISREDHDKRRLPPGEHGFTMLFNSYRRVARKKLRDFTLTKTEFRILTQSDCYYCGTAPHQVFRPRGRSPRASAHAAYTYNGVDRLDSSKGYTQNNVVSCCGPCNQLKMDLSLEEFYAKIELIFNRRIKNVA